MSSAAIAHPPEMATDERMVLGRVSWDTYERLLADDEGRRIPRMTFDQGVLELVTPSMPHDEDAVTVARLVEIVSTTLDIPIRSVGSTTFRRNDLERGFEADASFYIQSEARIRGLREVDLSDHPPPDLILEIEMSRSAINKLELFASMGIPEIWRYDGEHVTILVLVKDHYEASSSSLALSLLTSGAIARFLVDSRTMLSPAWSRMVSAWIREQRAVS